jgi:hypothetical protein
MSLRFVLTVACVTAVGLLAPGLAMAAKPFKVASSLDGKTVLPRHLRWLAFPTLSAADVKQVEFRIDGKLRAVEQQAPYVYGEDENGAHKGFLVTTWLSPGKHRFTVRAVGRSGVATDTVTARVLPAPQVPPALAGTWQRNVTGPIPPDPGAASQNPVPGGVYRMTFDLRYVRETNPGTYTAITSDSQVCNGCILLEDYVAGPSTLLLWGAVTTHITTDNDPVGGWWCYEDGPPTRYSWTVSGNTLTLAPIGGKDPCNQRGSVWTGTWTHV